MTQVDLVVSYGKEVVIAELRKNVRYRSVSGNFLAHFNYDATRLSVLLLSSTVCNAQREGLTVTRVSAFDLLSKA